MNQEKSIPKRGINSLKENGFRKTLYKALKFIKGTGVFSSFDNIRALWFSDKEILNFGDNLTPYLIEKLTDKKPYLVNRYCYKKHYLMAGSILSEANKNSIIFGTGIMVKNEKIKKPKKILAVRGPLTRKRLIELGYICPEVYGDPALLLPLVYKPKVTEQYKIGVVPHYVDYNQVQNQIGNNDDFLIINVFNPVEKVIDDINKCEKTISSSLHGLIVSHAYNKPSLWVKFSDNLAGDSTKFYDYLYSVNIKPYNPLDLRSHIPQPQEIEEKINKELDIAKPKSSTIQGIQKNLMDLWPLAIHKNNEN